MEIDNKFLENAKNEFYSNNMFFGFMRLHASIKNLYNNENLVILNTEMVLKNMNRFIDIKIKDNIINGYILTNVKNDTNNKLIDENFIIHETMYNLLYELKYYLGDEKSVFDNEYFFHPEYNFDKYYNSEIIDFDDTLFSNLLRFILSNNELFYRYCSYVYMFKIFFYEQDSVVNGITYNYEEIIYDIERFIINNELNFNYSKYYTDKLKNDKMKPFFRKEEKTFKNNFTWH